MSVTVHSSFLHCRQDRKQLASLTSVSCVAALVDLACESGTAKTEATAKTKATHRRMLLGFCARSASTPSPNILA